VHILYIFLLSPIQDQYENKDGSRATIDQLKEFGITVYIAEHGSIDMYLLQQVVQHAMSCKSTKRCLLYRDTNGRLYNLTLNNGCSGLAGTWKSLLLSFSGIQALVALTVLTRTFGCSNVSDAILKPGYISLILGLILYEEISHVSLNVAMFVRGVPSVGAYTLLSVFDSDWPRKAVVFLLAITSAMDEGSSTQRYCTLVGIGLAMLLLAANLGSRAWYFMKWRPLSCCGGTFLAPIVSLFVAALVGLIFPYIGFNKIQAGGKAAVQLVIINTIIVAGLFVVSDLDVIQHFLIKGSDSCNQDNVNITLGIWIAMTSITSIFAAKNIAVVSNDDQLEGEGEDDNDQLLVEDHASPCGYKIPNFPDHPVDPVYFGSKGCDCLSLKFEILFGLVISVGVGFFVVSTSMYDYMGVIVS